MWRICSRPRSARPPECKLTFCPGGTPDPVRCTCDRLVSAEVLDGKKARGRDPAADGITAKDAETFATVKTFEQRPQKGREKSKRRRK